MLVVASHRHVTYLPCFTGFRSVNESTISSPHCVSQCTNCTNLSILVMHTSVMRQMKITKYRCEATIQQDTIRPVSTPIRVTQQNRIQPKYAFVCISTVMWYSHDGILSGGPSAAGWSAGPSAGPTGSGVGSGILNMFNISDPTPDPTPDRTPCEHNTGPSAGQSNQLCKFQLSLKQFVFIVWPTLTPIFEIHCSFSPCTYLLFTSLFVLIYWTINWKPNKENGA